MKDLKRQKCLALHRFEFVDCGDYLGCYKCKLGFRKPWHFTLFRPNYIYRTQIRGDNNA